MHKLTTTPPTLVAHRGYSGSYPENTLLSYQAAYDCGARFMELDLQLTNDNVPVLQHDQSLLRMAGVDIDIRDIEATQLTSLRASYPDRFGYQFSDNTFTTFEVFCEWLKQHPDVTIFVEIKQESIDRVGVAVFVDETLKRIETADVGLQCVMISFNQEVIRYTRTQSAMCVGWVLPKWDDKHKEILESLEPDFLFCDKNALPEDDIDIWQGDWWWAIYNLDDVESAIKMANRGMPYLETNEIGTLIADIDIAPN